MQGIEVLGKTRNTLDLRIATHIPLRQVAEDIGAWVWTQLDTQDHAVQLYQRNHFGYDIYIEGTSSLYVASVEWTSNPKLDEARVNLKIRIDTSTYDDF